MAGRAWKPNARRWVIAEPWDHAEQFARDLRTSPLVAQLLYNRGLRDLEAARAFRRPKLTDLHDAAELPGCVDAARRIAAAVRSGQRIVIYGDYDVDGMAAVAILHAALRMVEAPVDFYIPHRLDEGYGLSDEAIDKIVADGAKLIVTVDCGISAAGPIRRATDAGVEVIVTDHHTPPADLPAAQHVVHPMLGEYPNPNLCGTGVALKLAWQLMRELCGSTRVDEPMREFLLDATCLAAMGTIADVVDLVGENRALVAHGLQGLRGSKHPGLRALLRSASLNDARLEAYHVGFVLGPRLNACGRMGHARLAVELLTTAAPERAGQIAQYLAEQNTRRQQVERKIAAEAIERATAEGFEAPDRRAIVLAGDDWHGGVIGICASRLVDRFSRPTVLIAFNGDGLGHGSARSVPGFHMRDALAACAEHLVSFGGHAMAGGLKIDPEKLPAFCAAFTEYARAHVPDEQLTPSLEIDAETTVAALGYPVVDQIARMAPFGQGNPAPVVALRGCRIVGEPKRIGRTGSTVSLMLSQGPDAAIRAVGFRMGDLVDELRGQVTVDVAAEPVLNTFRGRTRVELKLRDVRWED